MTTHPFLSEAWIEEARRIHAEYRGRTAPVDQQIRVNLIVTDVPFGEGNVDEDGFVELVRAAGAPVVVETPGGPAPRAGGMRTARMASPMRIVLL